MTTRYVLDTNVVSLLLWDQDEVGPPRLVQQLPQESVFLRVITIGEIQRGISRLPLGKRLSELEQWFIRIQATYDDVILAITRDTALLWGELSARMQSTGHNVKAPDLLMAATALEHDLTVVTRNVRDFTPTDVALLDPWNPPAESAPSTSVDAS